MFVREWSRVGWVLVGRGVVGATAAGRLWWVVLALVVMPCASG